jgi:MFS family permease
MAETATAVPPTVTRERARTAYLRLCAAAFLAYCSYAICRTPLLPLFARDLGADLPLVGLVVGASTLTGVVLKLPAGAWSDVLGRRPLLVAGAIVFAATPFAYLAVSTLTALIVVRAVHGSATAIFGPVASAHISDLAPPARRGAWLSTYSTIQGAGQALGPIVAGYLIAGGRFEVVFAAAGLLALAVPFIVSTGATGSSETSSEPRPGRWTRFARGIVEVGRDRLVLVTSGAQAGLFVLNGALNAFLPLYGREVLGLTAPQLGWLFGLQTITTLASRPIMGRMSDWIGRRGMIIAGLSLSSAAVALVPRAGGLGSLMTVILVYAVGVAVSTAATSAFITDLTRRARYGAAHGVFGTIYDVGDALGPIAAGLLVASLGYARMFQTVAGAAAVAAMAFWLLSRDSNRRMKGR